MLDGAGAVSDFSIEIKGLAALTRKLGAQRVNDMIRKTTLGVAEVLKGHLAKYPGPSHRPVVWSSRKQRAWYFAMRAKQGLPLKYARNSDSMSQRLGPSWATKNQGQNAIIGTRVTYARWVQNEEEQQPMHRATGWITDQGAIEKAQQEGAAETVWQRILGSWVKE